MTTPSTQICTILPCYRVKSQILDTLKHIPSEISLILVIDDCCPEESGKFVESQCKDPRVKVLYHTQNQGVGGAMVTGYREALKQGADIVIKMDGDGQMDPRLIPRFIGPIQSGKADYTKGNRFYRLESLLGMPKIRLFGNAVLSFTSKISSGYWNVMDPTNGYTAIHRSALSLLPLDKLDRRYFFESDLLFRLNTIRAVIQDIPMNSKYGDEVSSLNIKKVAFEFPLKYLRSFLKRIFYSYFLRDFNLGSLELLLGSTLFSFGTLYGSYHLIKAIQTGQPSANGVVMLAALPIILGVQILLSAISYDMLNQPQIPIQSLLSAKD